MTQEPGQPTMPGPTISEGTVVHAEVLAALHDTTFTHPWSRQAFQDMLRLPTVRVWIADSVSPIGFILTQATADEVEILTLAVLTNQRRAGVGHNLVQTALAYAAQHGATICHLEVAEDNGPAKNLYATFGFEVTGCRPGYYARPQGAVDAVLMTKDLK